MTRYNLTKRIIIMVLIALGIGAGIASTTKSSKEKNDINKNLKNKIDGKYPWYFINIVELKGKGTSVKLYGFDEKPRHPKSEGILSHHANNEITHELYSKEVSGAFSKKDLDEDLIKYAKYNTGAAYSDPL